MSNHHIIRSGPRYLPQEHNSPIGTTTRTRLLSAPISDPEVATSPMPMGSASIASDRADVVQEQHRRGRGTIPLHNTMRANARFAPYPAPRKPPGPDQHRSGPSLSPSSFSYYDPQDPINFRHAYPLELALRRRRIWQRQAGIQVNRSLSQYGQHTPVDLSARKSFSNEDVQRNHLPNTSNFSHCPPSPPHVQHTHATTPARGSTSIDTNTRRRMTEENRPIQSSLQSAFARQTKKTYGTKPSPLTPSTSANPNSPVVQSNATPKNTSTQATSASGSVAPADLQQRSDAFGRRSSNKESQKTTPSASDDTGHSDQQQQPNSFNVQVHSDLSDKLRGSSAEIKHEKSKAQGLTKVEKWLNTWKMNDPEICCICFLDLPNNDNPFVYCDGPDCEVIVHKECYAIHKLPGEKETWLCDRCRALKNTATVPVACALCPETRGAFRRLATPFLGMDWVHVTCALWIPGVRILDKNNIKGITLDNVTTRALTATCVACKDSNCAEYGACIYCTYPGCENAFHVSCGFKCLLLRKLKAMARTHAIRCFEHASSNKQSGAIVERRINNWDRWVDQRDAYLKLRTGYDPLEKLCKAWESTLVRLGKLEAPSDDQPLQAPDAIKLFQTLAADRMRGIEVNVPVSIAQTQSDVFNNGTLKDGQRIKQQLVRTLRAHEDNYIDDPKLSDPSPEVHFPIDEAFFEEPPPQAPCTECRKTTLDSSTLEKLHLTEEYMARLEETRHLRKDGYTGRSTFWDPRVIIQCSVCKREFHCGCTNPPIKDYPKAHVVFRCLDCDMDDEELFHQRKREQDKQKPERLRSRKTVNYKI